MSRKKQRRWTEDEIKSALDEPFVMDWTGKKPKVKK